MKVTYLFFLLSAVKAKRFIDRMRSGVDVQAFDVGLPIKDDFDIAGFPELKFNPNDKQAGKSKVPPIESRAFLSPRDEALYNKSIYRGKKQKNGYIEEISNKTQSGQRPLTRPYDFSRLLEKNLVNPSRMKFEPLAKSQDSRTTENIDNVRSYFESHRFYKKTDIKKKFNWTTCDEFVRKSVFHPDDIINTQWLPFYMWYEYRYATAVVHTFSYPTKKRVQYYKTKYGRYCPDKIKWNSPKLLMKEMREILLVAGDRRGLFYGIPDQDLSTSLTESNTTHILPVITMRMKIHDPYLVMMYCDQHLAAIMAELNTGPETDEEKAKEASVIKFRGKGGPVSRNHKEEEQLAEKLKQHKIDAEARKFLKVPRF